MKQSGYLYNNEAIAAIAIGYFMKLHKEIEVAKILCVLPFILHEPSVKKLRNQSNKRSLEEFITKNTECVIGFNSRFLDFLPLSINVITILAESRIIAIEKDRLVFNDASPFSPDNFSGIGNRAKNFFPAIRELHQLMLNEKTNSFYLKLKVTL